MAANQQVLSDLDLSGNLLSAAMELSGAKGSIEAIMGLGMAYTLEKDDILHKFLCGTESIADLCISRAVLTAEVERLQDEPQRRAKVHSQLAVTR